MVGSSVLFFPFCPSERSVPPTASHFISLKFCPHSKNVTCHVKCSVKCHDQADFLFCISFLPPFSSAFSLVKQHIWTAQPQPKPHLQSVSPSSLLHLNFSLHTSSCKIFSRAYTPTVTWCLSLRLVFPFLLLLQQSFLFFPVDMPCYVVQIPS